MLSVAIRVDASSEMGSGHLRRCLSLAQALRQCGARVWLVCRPLDHVAAGVLAGSDFPVRWLSPPAGSPGASEPASEGGDAPAHAPWARVDWRTDARETAALLLSMPPDWLIIDHYAFDARWHAELRRILGCRLAVIDDLADRRLDADLLIDHNWQASHANKYADCLSRPVATIPILGGPRFALLAPEYIDASPCVVTDAVRSIGIFLGGADPANHSERVLQVCREQAGFDGPIELVTTSANPNLEVLQQACVALPDTQLSVDLPDLVSFFGRHDLQIGAGGGATWERCCLGVPSLVLMTAANQAAVLPALMAMGVAQLGTLPDGAAGAAELGMQIRTLMADAGLRRAMSQAGRRLVDGRGAERVALVMCRAALRVRPATMADARLLHGWRNHPSIRCVSASHDEIAWSDHENWMRAVLADPRRYLLVAEVGATPVGSIRFDWSEPATAEVSLYLDPDLHGLGLGRELLMAGEDWLSRQCVTPLCLLASVLPENQVSRRLFLNAGYTGGPTLYSRILYRKIESTSP